MAGALPLGRCPRTERRAQFVLAPRRVGPHPTPLGPGAPDLSKLPSPPQRRTRCRRGAPRRHPSRRHAGRPDTQTGPQRPQGRQRAPGRSAQPRKEVLAPTLSRCAAAEGVWRPRSTDAMNSVGSGRSRGARVTRLVSFSATHRLHRWVVPRCPQARELGPGVRVGERPLGPMTRGSGVSRASAGGGGNVTAGDGLARSREARFLRGGPAALGVAARSSRAGCAAPGALGGDSEPPACVA